MKTRILFIFLLVLLVVASGCINQTVVGSGIAINSYIYPSSIYPDSETTLSIDTQNTDISAVDVNVDVFDSGILVLPDAGCTAQYEKFLPKEIKTLTCKLTSPPRDRMTQQSTPVNIQYKVTLNKLFSAPISFYAMSYDEYSKEQQAGTLVIAPRTYTFSDPNMMIDITFTKDPPFIARESEKVLMYINIQSLGSGFLKDIDANNFMIEDNEHILDCDFGRTWLERSNPGTTIAKLTAIKGKFPPITCELNLDDQENYIRNFIIIIKYNYDYEIRGSVPVTIIK